MWLDRLHFLDTGVNFTRNFLVTFPARRPPPGGSHLTRAMTLVAKVGALRAFFGVSNELSLPVAVQTMHTIMGSVVRA